jgi:thiamine pyrophosphate-dependent acetolactate synthase large subunit-like protein
VVVDEAARTLVEARFPVILAGRGTPTTSSWTELVALAEELEAAVVPDLKVPASFPTSHRLMQGGASMLPDDVDATETLRRADVVLSLDRIDLAGTLRAAGTSDDCVVIHTSLDHHASISSSQQLQELPWVDIHLTADVDLTVAALRRQIGPLLRETTAHDRRAARRSVHEEHRRRMLQRWRAQRNAAVGTGALSLAQVVAELARTFDGRLTEVIMARVPLSWPNGIWPFDGPLSYLGSDGGAGVGSGPGMAVGSALAARGTGRPVVAVLGDGDVVMAPQAIWTAVHSQIPLLLVVANNQSFFNDEVHQAAIAKSRGRDERNCWIGQRMTDPAIDYAKLARALGAAGFGPATDERSLARALRSGVACLDRGGIALVDARVARPLFATEVADTRRVP